MKKPRRCPYCKGKEFEEDTHRDQREVAGYTFAANLRAFRCKSCSELLFELNEVGRFDKQIAGWLAGEGILSGEAFRFMRKAIGLRSGELAELLDLAPETLSRWEREHRQPDRRAMAVLGSLVLDKLNGQDQTLKRLRALGSVQGGSKPVDLTDSFQAA